MQTQIKINDQAWITVARQFQAGASEISQNVVTKTATFMERTAKENINQAVYATPAGEYKRTGKARQSITRSGIGPLVQRVVGGVNYLKYIEQGAGEPAGHKAWWTKLSNITGNEADSKRAVKIKGFKARPFWVPAIETTENQIPKIWYAEIHKIK